ncbi:MAG: hypothetical protein ACE5IZ_08880 [Dehalococcoidia bacterium]
MSGKLQREIEEILSRYDKSGPRRKWWRRWPRRLRQALAEAWAGLTFRLPRISLGQVMLLGILLLLIAFFFRSTTPYTVYAGLALFFGAFILSFRRSQARPEVRWRGRPMDLSQPGVGDRIRQWWQRRGQRRR